jgi:prolyl 4-hydroxylase
MPASSRRSTLLRMSITIALSSGLRSWLADGLQQNLSSSLMIDALIARQFDPQIAAGLVQAFFSARATGRPLPENTVRLDVAAPEYQYETPRIASGNVIRAGDREIRVLQRLQRPIVVTLSGVLSDEECERLIELAAPRILRSTVTDPRTGTTVVGDHRNSDGVFFRLRENSFIAELDQRLSALMNCPVENGEGLQVLRYGPGGQVRPHFDFLVPSNATNSESIARSGQRLSTLIVYLNDVLEGGETVFPEIGLSVVPRRGDALYFEYTNSRMQTDLKSAHAGAPVGKGEKWIVTKWMRTQRFIPAPVA